MAVLNANNYTWIFSPCLRKHQFIVVSIFCVYSVLFSFFFICPCQCQLPVHCLMISGGVDDVIFSNTTFAQVLEQKNPSDTKSTNRVTQLHVYAKCKCYHTQVFLLFSHFPVFMTNVFFLNQTLCAFSIALNWHLSSILFKYLFLLLATLPYVNNYINKYIYIYKYLMNIEIWMI